MRRAFHRLHVSATALAMLWLQSGCSSAPRTHHLDIGGRYDSYREEANVPLDRSLSSQTGMPFTMRAGDPSVVETRGRGFHLGVTEQTKRWVARLVFFRTTYDPVTYSVTSPETGDITLVQAPSALGLDASIGYQLSVLRPHLSYKYQQMTFKQSMTGTNLPSTMSSNPSQTQLFIGGGMTVDLPVSRRFHLVMDTDYRVPLVADGSVREWTAQAGVRIGGWNGKR